LSCPEWKGLLAHRLEPDGAPEPEGWTAAVEHLDDCPVCRRQAFSLDPSLLFVAQAPPSVDDAEVGRIKANVHTLLRARAAERTSHRVRRGLGRFAAAAAVVALMVLLPTHTSRQALTAPAALPGLASDAGAIAASDAGLMEAPAPVIEPLDLPAARIYQLGGENFSIVMVVDDSIDV
jgi:hypothetical protein